MIGIAKIFETVQGEGAYSGVPTLFVRTAGCSVGCPGCDTNYKFVRRLHLKSLADEINASSLNHVWVTGGEPTDWPEIHELPALCPDKHMALATSGCRMVPNWAWDFISVSPHNKAAHLHAASQVNFVPLLNGMGMSEINELMGKMLGREAYVYFTPLEGSKESLGMCLEMLKKWGNSRLGIQAHKVWGLE